MEGHDSGHRGEISERLYCDGQELQIESSGTLDRATDVSKHRTAFTFRVKQFKESCLTL